MCRTAFTLLAVALTIGSGAWAARARHVLLGRSSDGRLIVAYELRGSAPRKTVLVVGCIHGNEPAGIAVAQQLLRLAPRPGIDLWVIPLLNPDGRAAGARGNGRGVDLNRNFPWHWQDSEGTYDSGEHALSEPESRLVARLILRLRPRISIWFHQHLDLVDLSGGDTAIEKRFARAALLPQARLPRYRGSVVNWENATIAGSTAFVVELPAGTQPAAAARRYANAVYAAANGTG